MWEAIWPGLWRAKFVASAYFFSKGTAKEDAVSLPPTVEFREARPAFSTPAVLLYIHTCT